MQRGRGGVWQSFPPEGGNGELNETRSKAAGVDRSYQLSGVSWVSMSTLQMGHFLLVASHWSTHAWWKRCMQGNLLQTRERHGQDFKRNTGLQENVQQLFIAVHRKPQISKMSTFYELRNPVFNIVTRHFSHNLYFKIL